MNKHHTHILAAFAVIALSACSKKEVSNDTLEDARSQSLQNGVLVAKAYIRENPRLAGYDVVGHSDEHQTADCPQGSGWVHNSALKNEMDENGKLVKTVKVKLVCSSVSANIGCYREEDFKTTAFSEREAKCDEKLPFPLPKVVGKS